MNIGDYVRNKFGIAKVIDIENNNGTDILVFDKPICFLVNKKTGEIKDNRLLNKLAIIDGVDVSKIKSSPNIIDLIEVGDYVNGERVFSKHNNWDDKKYRILADSTEGYISEEHIYSVVTKEQFKEMEYKIK